MAPWRSRAVAHSRSRAVAQRQSRQGAAVPGRSRAVARRRGRAVAGTNNNKNNNTTLCPITDAQLAPQARDTADCNAWPRRSPLAYIHCAGARSLQSAPRLPQSLARPTRPARSPALTFPLFLCPLPLALLNTAAFLASHQSLHPRQPHPLASHVSPPSLPATLPPPQLSPPPSPLHRPLQTMCSGCGGCDCDWTSTSCSTINVSTCCPEPRPCPPCPPCAPCPEPEPCPEPPPCPEPEPCPEPPPCPEPEPCPEPPPCPPVKRRCKKVKKKVCKTKCKITTTTCC